MSVPRLTAVPERANDTRGRCALWPSGDAHRPSRLSAHAATSFGLAAPLARGVRGTKAVTLATPQSEGLVRVRGRVCLRTTRPRPPGVASVPAIPPGRVGKCHNALYMNSLCSFQQCSIPHCIHRCETDFPGSPPAVTGPRKDGRPVAKQSASRNIVFRFDEKTGMQRLRGAAAVVTGPGAPRPTCGQVGGHHSATLPRGWSALGSRVESSEGRTSSRFGCSSFP